MSLSLLSALAELPDFLGGCPDDFRSEGKMVPLQVCGVSREKSTLIGRDHESRCRSEYSPRRNYETKDGLVGSGADREKIETQSHSIESHCKGGVTLPLKTLVLQEITPVMSLGQQLAPHLPFLRRYGRALTGSQQHGDKYVRATLEAIVAAPEEFPRDVDPRLGLYRTFQVIWGSANYDEFDDHGGDVQDQAEAIARARLARMTPLSRQALLLTAMEGFTPEDAAYLIDVDGDEVDGLVKQALSEIEQQTRARVLIIEDEPIIAMDIETIVRDLGHDVTGVAVTRDEAVALAMEDRPGLVLADIQLADDSSGIDAVKDILAEFNVPVIFITAFPERLLTGERPEPTFLITKPFQRSTVKAAISQALFFDQATVPAS
jgi:CheY-like chemotaxis protein/DNA-directed RNA polymerase specialized sigma24 family protein